MIMFNSNVNTNVNTPSSVEQANKRLINNVVKLTLLVMFVTLLSVSFNTFAGKGNTGFQASGSAGAGYANRTKNEYGNTYRYQNKTENKASNQYKYTHQNEYQKSKSASESKSDQTSANE